MKFRYLIILVTIFINFSVEALELKTHLYVAEEILADLQDGKLTIEPFGDFEVNQEKVYEILQNKDYFLLGSIGPDVIPDFLGGQLTLHAGQGGWTTDDWLKYIKMYPSSNSPDWQWQALYYGYLMHAASDIFSHTYVNNYAGDVFDFNDSDDLQIELRHKLLEMFIAKYQPNQNVDTTWKNSIDLWPIKEWLLDNNEVAEQYDQTGAGAYLYKMKQFEDEVQRLSDLYPILQRAIKAVINKNLARQQYYQDLIEQYDTQHGEILNQTQAQVELIRELNGLSQFAVCEILYKNLSFAQQSVKWLLGLCYWQSEVNDYLEDLILAEARLEELQESISHFFENNPELAEAAQALGLPQLTRSEAAEALVTVAALIVFGNELDLKAIAFDYAMARYRDIVVTEAGLEYINANMQTAANLVEQKGLIETLQPLKNWLVCYGPVYFSEVGTVMPDVCNIKAELDNFTERLKDTLLETIGDNELLNLYYSYQQFQNELKDLATSLGKDIVKNILTDEQEQMIGWLSAQVSDASLTAAFLQQGNNTRVLKIADIAQRVRGDMHLRADGTFDPKKFAPVFNAIQLSKLALLDPTELARLEGLAGLSPNNYPSSYYGYNGHFTVLNSWIGNLDGNHQWMPVSPKLPRQSGFDDPRTNYDRTFSLEGGFMFWKEAENREKLFQKLFIGPISLGIESPDLIGASNLLPSNKNTRNCYSEPFPLTGGDFEGCIPVAAWLIPVLYILN